MSWIAGLVLSALCLLGVNGALNNIDSMEPVLRVSPDMGASNNDYFGWAAILHPVEVVLNTDTMEDSLRKIRIIIGAPLGTFPGGLALPDVFLPPENSTGLIYNCPVSPGGCSGVRGDTGSYLNTADSANGILSSTEYEISTSNTEGRLFDQAPNSLTSASRTYENKTGQLLGSYLYSNGEKLLACAFRWQTAVLGTSNLPRGICYTGGRDLQGFRPLNPCSSHGAATSSFNHGTSGSQGFCTAGTSAVINGDNYVLGVPGYDSSKGLLASQSMSASSFTLGNSLPFTSDGSRNAALSNQYQGYQVINAYISSPRSSGQPDIIASVPRQGVSYTGRLHLYTAPLDVNTPIQTAAEGTQMAEFFGYSLAAADFNNDGYDEVIVGAPMYTDYLKDENERGRVYIFMNNGSGTGELNPDPIVLEGPGKNFRFGTSVAILGDIDRDGFPDIAIGAPYNISGSTSGNTGTVFIYYGTENPNDIPLQTPFTITADDMAEAVDLGLNGLTSLKTFGWSVSSGQDVDGNGYNDLAVGAYDSQAVFILRTLPIVDVSVSFSSQATIDIDQMSSFQLEVQASFDGIGVADSLSISFLIREAAGTVRRLFFQESDKTAPGTGTFVLAGKNVTVSTMVTVFTESDISNFNPYVIEIELEQIPRSVAQVTGNQTISDLSAFPKIRHIGQKSTQIAVENFCGSDGCLSDLSFVSVIPETVRVVSNGDTLVSQEVTIINTGSEPALNIRLAISRIPSYIVSVTSDVYGCTGLNLMGLTSLVCEVSVLRLNQNERLVGTLVFGINNDDLIGNETDSLVDLALSVQPISNNTDIEPSNNAQTVTFAPTGEANIMISMSFPSPIENYTAMAPTPDELSQSGVGVLGQVLTLEVTISNTGPSTIEEAFFSVYLPLRSGNITGVRYFLYPTDIAYGTTPTIITCNEEGLNPDKLGSSSTSGRKRSASSLRLKRTRREAMRVASTKGDHVRKARQATANFDLDCSPTSLTRSECTLFSCSLSQLRPDNLNFNFRMRVDERFYETLEVKRNFLLKAYGMAFINSTYIEGDNQTDNTDSAKLTLQLATAVVQDTNLNLILAIVIPLIAVVILFILTIVLLYCCGFFRRKRKPDEGEIEGDFDVPKFQEPASEKPAMGSEAKEEVTIF